MIIISLTFKCFKYKTLGINELNYMKTAQMQYYQLQKCTVPVQLLLQDIASFAWHCIAFWGIK